jgi:hypothetical protein
MRIRDERRQAVDAVTLVVERGNGNRLRVIGVERAHRQDRLEHVSEQKERLNGGRPSL